MNIMSKDELTAYNNFTDLLASLIAKYGNKVSNLPEDKRALRRRLKMYIKLLGSFYETDS